MLVQPSLASPGSPLFTASHTLSPRHTVPPEMIPGMMPGMMYPSEYMMMMPNEGIPAGILPTTGYTQGLCYTFRDTGTCKYGNTCKFAHLPQGNPYFQTPMPYVTSPLIPPHEDGYHQPQPQSAGICYQWRDTGTCSYGDTCKFDHHHEGQEDDGHPREGHYDDITPTSPSRSVASTPRFRGDMLITSSNEIAISPLSSFSSTAATPPMSSKKPICYQWRDSGVCKFGDSCKFGHYTKKSNHSSPHHAQQQQQQQQQQNDLVDMMSQMSFQSHLIPIVNPHYHDEDEEENPASGTMSPIQPLTTPMMIPPQFQPQQNNTYYPSMSQPAYYYPQPLYSPTLCVPFLQTGTCRYGDRCRYQHGTHIQPTIDMAELQAQQAYAMSLAQQQQYQQQIKNQRKK